MGQMGRPVWPIIRLPVSWDILHLQSPPGTHVLTNHQHPHGTGESITRAGIPSMVHILSAGIPRNAVPSLSTSLVICISVRGGESKWLCCTALFLLKHIFSLPSHIIRKIYSIFEIEHLCYVRRSFYALISPCIYLKIPKIEHGTNCEDEESVALPGIVLPEHLALYIIQHLLIWGASLVVGLAFY